MRVRACRGAAARIPALWLLLLSYPLSVRAQAPSPTPTPAAQQPTPPAGEIPRVDMSALDPAKRAAAVKILEENRCTCGCGMILRTCLEKDLTCPRSPSLAAEIVRSLAAGVAADEVVRTVLAAPAAGAAAAGAAPAAGSAAAPAQEMEFDVPVGDSYFVGPESATVTLVSWLDYQ